MKEKKEINTTLSLEQTTCRLLHPGDVIYYKRKLWVILNPVTEKKSKLIRVLLKDQEGQSMVMPGKTKVSLVTRLTTRRK